MLTSLAPTYEHFLFTISVGPSIDIMRILAWIGTVSLIGLANSHPQHRETIIAEPTSSINGVSGEVRAHWMRQASANLESLSGSPCPVLPFGAVVVNHTDPNAADGLGELICMGANSSEQGDPTLHGKYSNGESWAGRRLAYQVSRQEGAMLTRLIGEMAAIRNCSKILTDPNGRFKLSPEEALLAFTKLSLYTNAEACPMVCLPFSFSGEPLLNIF